MKINRSKSKPLAKARADKWFSIYIRLRDANSSGLCTCFATGKVGHWKTFDAGHFISRKYESTRFDERNVHAQSRGSNRFQGGDQGAHAVHVQRKYGVKVIEDLYIKSKMLCKRTRYDYEYLATEYKNMAQKLSTEKRIPI